MVEELKACPFCGDEYPELYNDGGKYPMVICPKCCKSWPAHLWNTRPIEDALRAENEALKADVASLHKDIDVMMDILVQYDYNRAARNQCA